MTKTVKQRILEIPDDCDLALLWYNDVESARLSYLAFRDKGYAERMIVGMHKDTAARYTAEAVTTMPPIG